MLPNVTVEEKYLILSALMTAEEIWTRDMKQFWGNNQRLADTFQHQAQDARELLHKLMNEVSDG